MQNSSLHSFSLRLRFRSKYLHNKAYEHFMAKTVPRQSGYSALPALSQFPNAPRVRLRNGGREGSYPSEPEPPEQPHPAQRCPRTERGEQGDPAAGPLLARSRRHHADSAARVPRTSGQRWSPGTGQPSARRAARRYQGGEGSSG